MMSVQYICASSWIRVGKLNSVAGLSLLIQISDSNKSNAYLYLLYGATTVENMKRTVLCVWLCLLVLSSSISGSLGSADSMSVYQSRALFCKGAQLSAGEDSGDSGLLHVTDAERNNLAEQVKPSNRLLSTDECWRCSPIPKTRQKIMDMDVKHTNRVSFTKQ